MSEKLYMHLSSDLVITFLEIYPKIYWQNSRWPDYSLMRHLSQQNYRHPRAHPLGRGWINYRASLQWTIAQPSKRGNADEHDVLTRVSPGVGGGGLVAKSCLTLATPWTVACQAPLSMGFYRQKYWNVGCHFLLQAQVILSRKKNKA